MRTVGVTARGIRLPIVKQGDNLADITVDSLIKARENENFSFNDKDVVAITESIVARAQGNYATINDIATDVRIKTGGNEIGLIFPILSRNRFSILLKGIAMGVKKIYLMLSYPRDEVGNALLTDDQIIASGVNPYSDVLDLKTYREKFGYRVHEFTGVDYIDYYIKLVQSVGCEIEVLFANHADAILLYCKKVITCDIHTRKYSKALLKNRGAELVLGLDEILNNPINNSGFNGDFGLLGSNKSTEDVVKLFPRDSQNLVEEIQNKMFKLTGKKIEVMVYGDGAFKDPQGKIWELADPVVSPFHTPGLKGTPNELKLKYLADNDFKNLKGSALEEAIKNNITNKSSNLVGQMASQGTTPRQITDLLGSLCDLVSGSGDKGTPVVLVQGYFDNYANE
ncbi:MAG: coenzyme F420-0:L-glutamate ligase [Bacilli bacterium]|nr:coenzyme F420-0:L-glutamate ligase [Bacilli bacterium]